VSAVEIAQAAGPGIGAGVGTWAGFRFVRWLVEFVWKRLDVRHERLAKKEKDLERRYDLRLKHLEHELAQTRKAMMLLLNHVAREDPTAVVLVTVAELLDGERLPPASDPALDELARKAGDALDASS
jgi:hypothetical protein